MTAVPSNPGIAAAPTPVPASAPAPTLPAPPAAANVVLPTPWPRSAQRVTAGLILVALGLLGWQAVAASRWGVRPTTLEAGATAFQVDLNRADHTQLLQLPGVGEAMAGRIEAYRRQYGRLRSVDDLRNVPGIGPATLERLRPFVYAQPAPDKEDEEDAPRADAPPVARPRQPAAAGPKAAAGSVKKKASAPVDRIDVNRASAEELQRLPGIGPAMAGRIVSAREQKPFTTVDDLRRVRGIGAKTLERLRPSVTVGAADAVNSEQ